MNKTHIVYVVTDSNYAGAGKYVELLCTHINKDNYKVTVIIPFDSKLLEVYGKIDDIHIVELDGIRDQSLSMKGISKLYKVFRNLNPDILHANACLSARIVGKICMVNKVFYTRHCLEPPMESSLKRFIYRGIQKCLKGNPVAISNAVKENLMDGGVDASKIKVVYNGIEESRVPSFETNYLRNKYNLNTGKCLIGLIGRLETVKGHEHMIAIAEKLIEFGAKGFEIIFVGEGTNEEKLQQLIRDKELPVQMIGHVDQIDEIYQCIDIVVNTSNSEALSYVAIEGMNYKLPVVAFDLPGINEVINHNQTGYLIPFKDYEEFGKKLIDLMNDPDLRLRMGEKGYEKVRERFSVRNMMDKIDELYGGKE